MRRLRVWLRWFFGLPAVSDDDETRQQRLLVFILRSVVFGVLLIALPVNLLFQDELTGYRYGISLSVLFFSLAGLWLVHRGRQRAVGYLFPFILHAAFTAGMLQLGGLHSPLAGIFVVTIVVVGLLLGGSWVLGFTTLSIVTVLLLYAADRLTLIAPPSVESGGRVMLVFCGVFAITGLLMHRAARILRDSLQHARELQAREAERARALDHLLAEERRRARQQALLADVGRQLAGLAEAQAVMDEAVRRICIDFGFEHALLCLREGHELVVRASYGRMLAAAPPGQRWPADQGVLGWVLRQGEASVVNDTAAAPRLMPTLGSLAAAEVAVPVRVGDAVAGVLDVSSKRPHAFADSDVAALLFLADLLAARLQASQLLEATRRQVTELSVLHAVAAAAANAESEDELIESFTRTISRSLYPDIFGVLLLDAEGRMLRPHASFHRGQGRPAALYVLPVGQGITGQVAQSGEPRRVDDVREDSRYDQADPTMRSELCVPLRVGGRLIGVVNAESTRLAAFSEADERLLVTLAGQLATALERLRLYAATRESLEREQRQAHKQQLLADAIREFTSGLSEDSVLQALARRMLPTLQACEAAVLQVDPLGTALVVAVQTEAGRQASAPVGTREMLGDRPLFQEVLTARRPRWVDATDPSGEPAERQRLQAAGHGAALLLPLLMGEQDFGLVRVCRAAGLPPFSLPEAQLAGSLAAQAAGALDNARLHAMVKEQVRELDALLTANAALLSTLDLEPLLENILSAALTAIPSAEKGSVLLHDSESGRLQIMAVAGYSDPQARSLEFAGPGSYAVRCWREARPLLIGDVQADPALRYAGPLEEVHAIRSAIAVPFLPHTDIQAETPLGVITLDATWPEAFNAGDLHLLEAFAATAAVAIDHARLHAELKSQAVTDGLTGLANHRTFERELRVEVSRASRYGYSLSLIFIDIDSFKLYNDTYGHLTGNDRLRAMARLLLSLVRHPDIVARYGGEEFVLLLPHTGKAGALILAERVRAAAAASAPPELAAGCDGPISGYSLSLGVATFPEDASTPEGLVLAADNAEIAAKRAGKNRVRAAPPLPA